ncbi:MAG TPA: hypothetical protein VK859_07035, partial [bacterium]|nr:hypothetical protein [bacterium]
MDAKPMALKTNSGVEPGSDSLSAIGEEKGERVPVLKEVGYNPGLFRVYALLGFYTFLGLFCYLLTSGGFLVEQKLWACLVMFLGMLPFILFFWTGHPGRIAFLPLLALYHAIAFGLPGFFAGTGDVTPQVLLPALKGSALGLFGLILGYYWAGTMLFSKVESFRLSFQPSMETILPYAWFFLILDQALAPVAKPWPIIGFLQQTIPLFGWWASCMIWLNYLREGNAMKRGNFIYLFIILPFEFLLRLTSGTIGAVMALVIMLGMVYVNYKKAIPIGMGVAIVFFAALMQPIKDDYRQLTWYGAGAGMTPVDKMEILWKLG